MFEHLNVRTRQIAIKLLAGNSIDIGEETFGPATEHQRLLLYILVNNIKKLKDETGAQLLESIVELLEGAETPTVEDKEEVKNFSCEWKIEGITTYSFRGLAPAGEEWTFPFDSTSHLIYGPNGSGKSSLLGAISWCLTGKIFRDDKKPSNPESVDIYATDDKAKKIGSRPDALTLTKTDGTSVDAMNEYWVSVHLIGINENSEEQHLFIKRHNEQGLSMSADGTTWNAISKLSEASISEIDTELFILNPARAPYTQFGANEEITHLFSQIIGLDDLEEISDVANKATRGSTKEAKTLSKDIDVLKTNEKEVIEALGESSTDKIKALDSYCTLTNTPISLDNIEAFGEQIKGMISERNKNLAVDLGIDIPDEESESYDEFLKEMDKVPGQASNALEELNQPITSIFKSTYDIDYPDEKECTKSEEALQNFIKASMEKINARLKWAIKEAEDPKISLLLKAAESFNDKENKCPVCEQSLETVSEISKSLKELKAASDNDYLLKEVRSLESELIDELDIILPRNTRQSASKPFTQKLQDDWNGLVSANFKGLFSKLPEPHSEKFNEILSLLSIELLDAPELLEVELKERSPEAFGELAGEIRLANQFILTASIVSTNKENISKGIASLCKPLADGGKEDSLSEILLRGSEAKDDVEILKHTRGILLELHKNRKKIEKITKKQSSLKNIADSLNFIKGLGTLAQEEVVSEVLSVYPRMNEYYQSLYSEEALPLDMLTSGHAANKNIKGQINVYLKAGNERIPAGPFSNAGRIRALVLSFIFALLDKSKGSFGTLILDDPATSLDDDHKARFIDRLVQPQLASYQIIMATHYENFFDWASPIFSESKLVNFPPRHRPCDALVAEPGDRLLRVQAYLKQSDSSWQGAPNILRQWAQSVLHTLSGYCETPFVIYNDFAASLGRLAALKKEHISLDSRDKIIASLKSPQFVRVANPGSHPGGSLTKVNVEDALKELLGCEKDYKKEVKRLKELYRHQLLGRQLNSIPSIEVMPDRTVIQDAEIYIIDQAAAAENGIGVSCSEETKVMLSGYQLALVKMGTISPIAKTGQYLLLDPSDNLPNNSDLVVAEANDGKQYLRRYWKDQYDQVTLSSENSTNPFMPVKVASGSCKLRKVVGVIYDGVGNCTEGIEGKEWVSINDIQEDHFSSLIGLRVRGTSLEPIARNNQVILVSSQNSIESTEAGSLACVNLEEQGSVLKRCYPNGETWTLISTNPNDVEVPMVIKREEILHVYKFVAILFEHDNEQ